jgi:rsbT co-antagonist protein RsbR
MANKMETAGVLRKYEQEILNDWVNEQLKGGGRQKALMKETELRFQCNEFLNLFLAAVEKETSYDPQGQVWEPVRDFLHGLSSSRTTQGFSPTETATFVFSLKRPLFARLRTHTKDPEGLVEEMMAVSYILDALGLFTTEIYQKAREELITRQQQDMMELSTPVVKLWDGVLALPLIGTLDSARTQVVMESLLQRILETGSSVAIIDITGVPTVDTLVAQHLLKTVTAARLMGADCIISGIRPQIAQTIVHLGVALNNVTTKSSLADAFQVALHGLNLRVTRTPGPAGERRM